MNKLRILFYQNGTSAGGSKRSLFEIIKTLYLLEEIELRIVCTNRGWFTGELENAEISYSYLTGLEGLIGINKNCCKKHPLTTLKTIFSVIPSLLKLWRWFFQLKPDLIVLNEGPRESLEFLPFLLFGKPRIVVISQIETELDSILGRIVCRRADKVFAASEAVKRHFISHGYTEEKVKVVPLIVEVTRNVGAKKLIDIRSELGLYDNIKLIGNISSLHPRKGLKELITTFSVVSEKKKNVRLLHLGGLSREDEDGKLYEKELKTLVQELGLENEVYFLGWREDLPLWLEQIDLILMPTHREGLCRAAVEALWAGVPIISYALDSMREVVRDGETGYLVDLGRTKELAEKALAILDDDMLRKRMSLKSQELWQEKFKPEISREITKEAFLSLSRRI